MEMKYYEHVRHKNTQFRVEGLWNFGTITLKKLFYGKVAMDC